MTGTHEQWDIVSGLGVTALAVALARAMETRRPGGLIQDPFAELFVAASELPEPYAHWPRADAAAGDLDPPWDSMPLYMGVRARFFDEFLLDAVAGGVRQVVLIAAGLDSRAYRLDWPAGTDLFEVDQPLVIKFKDEVLGEAGARSRCARHAVPVDLRDDWPAALSGEGFDPAQPTVWVAEGLLSFLSPQAERDLLGRIGDSSAPGSRLALEAAPGHDRHGVLKSRFAAAEDHIGVSVAALWQTDPRPDPADLLRAGGWTVGAERVAEAAGRYGRVVPGVMSDAANHTRLITATR
ncbi:SAM-dependent methyltransferase [Actinomadura fulvescens]|uniref:S-adenosyl-L-methionine-dependent methyltransferase n=1 Tax=Actinomadura fulvescens TaxID=46160 RepID=A0ABP6C467_9ACTN